MSEAAPFEDSRRLTGANLYFDGAGAALESAPGLALVEGVLQRWQTNIERVRQAIGWPAGAVVPRVHATGASLAFEAPGDQLYTATEANEWALYAALGQRADDTPVDGEASPRPHVAHFDEAQALAQLRLLAAAEARPALRELMRQAAARGIPAYADDDVLSMGEGEAWQAWPVAALPAASRAQGRVAMRDLANYAFVAMAGDSYPGAREWLEETCAKAGFSCRILREAEQEADALKFVADGFGAALITQRRPPVLQQGVSFHTLTPPLRRHSSMAWRSGPLSESLAEYIRNVKDLHLVE